MNYKGHTKFVAVASFLILTGVFITACASDAGGDAVENGNAAYMAEAPPPGALPPMIFVDDVLFITTGSQNNPALDERWIFVGEVGHQSSGMPTRHLQTNFNTLYIRGEMTDVVGVGRVYWSPNAAFPVWSPDVATSPPKGTVTVYGEGIIIDVDGHYFHFASMETRERMDDILFGRSAVVPQLVEPVDYILCPLCGDHYIGEDLRTPTPPLFIREWNEVDEEFWDSRGGRTGLTYIEHSGTMDNPIARIEQWWGRSQLGYHTMLLWSDEGLSDLRVVALGFNGLNDEMSFYVRHELLTIDWLSPNSMIMINAGLFHYLIPRMGITFTDAAGHHHRMLIHESMKGGCHPLFHLGVFDENHFAAWDDSRTPLSFVKRDMNVFGVHGLSGRIFVDENMHDIYLAISGDIDIVGLYGEFIEGGAQVTQDSIRIRVTVSHNQIIGELFEDTFSGAVIGPGVEFEYMPGIGLVDGITLRPFEFYNDAHPPQEFEISEADAVAFAHTLLKALEMVTEYRSHN